MMAVQLELGERLKVEGQDRAAGNNAEWLRKARAFAAWSAGAQWEWGVKICGPKTISADEIQEWAERTGNHPRSSAAYGAIFRGKHWRCVGRARSRIPSNHAREIRVWEYVP